MARSLSLLSWLHSCSKDLLFLLWSPTCRQINTPRHRGLLTLWPKSSFQVQKWTRLWSWQKKFSKRMQRAQEESASITWNWHRRVLSARALCPLDTPRLPASTALPSWPFAMKVWKSSSTSRASSSLRATSATPTSQSSGCSAWSFLTPRTKSNAQRACSSSFSYENESAKSEKYIIVL